MSLMGAKDSKSGEVRDLRSSSNGDLLQVTGRLMSGKTTKTLAAATDYNAEDVLADSLATAWEFKDIVAQVNGGGVIVGARALCSTTALTFRTTLYLFDAIPTANKTDNGANTTLLAADLLLYKGYINLPALEDLGGYSEAIATQNTADSKLPLPFVIKSNSRDLYGILVTRDAITGEAASMTMTIELFVELY